MAELVCIEFVTYTCRECGTIGQILTQRGTPISCRSCDREQIDVIATDHIVTLVQPISEEDEFAAAQTASLEQDTPKASGDPINIDSVVTPSSFKNGEECSICLSGSMTGDIHLKKCGHPFHYGCISRWLSEGDGKCPICKASVV